MKIESVCIVGGGSSGWMTAAALSKLCPFLQIALVESKTIKTVGVGESTLGHINRFMRLLGLTDDMWMKECNATYKNSIRFTNFRENDGTHFEYPFSNGFDFTDKHHGLNSWSDLASKYPDQFQPHTFAEFYVTANTLLAKHNKQTKDLEGNFRNFNFSDNTAYHMDAELFGQWLKNNIAIPNGVVHIFGDVRSYVLDDDANIVRILTNDGTTIDADLYIDCTGFKSLLLEKWMGIQFQPFSDSLANDSAIACRIPYTDREKEMHNVTDCHALGSGWVWNIPLWNRIGTGYCYSSRFITQEEAEVEFREHLAKSDPQRAEQAEFFKINIRHGKRKRAWVNNVVGIGLSYGFVEPLESTGLLTTHENIIKLVEVLNRRTGYVTQVEKEAFNYTVDNEMEGWKDFISMHYALSMRTDTPYWRWATQRNQYKKDLFDGLQRTVTGVESLFHSLHQSHCYPEQFQGLVFITAGMGIKPTSTPELLNEFFKHRNITDETLEDTKRKYEQYYDYVMKIVDESPSHYQYLKDNIYGGIDEYV